MKKAVEKGEQPFSQTVHTHNQPLPLRPRFPACSSRLPFSLFPPPSDPSHSSLSLPNAVKGWVGPTRTRWSVWVVFVEHTGTHSHTILSVQTPDMHQQNQTHHNYAWLWDWYDRKMGLKIISQMLLTVYILLLSRRSRGVRHSYSYCNVWLSMQLTFHEWIHVEWIRWTWRTTSASTGGQREV